MPWISGPAGGPIEQRRDLSCLTDSELEALEPIFTKIEEKRPTTDSSQPGLSTRVCPARGADFHARRLAGSLQA